MSTHLPEMPPGTTMAVDWRPGEVVVRATPDVARVLADAWELLHGRSRADATARPLFLNDVAALKRAAVSAEQAAGIDVRQTHPVPLTVVRDLSEEAPS